MKHSKEFYINQKVKELKELLAEKYEEDFINLKNDNELIYKIRSDYCTWWIMKYIQ